jgi:hypothetical protein
MESNEKLLFSNSFGTITDKRIILNHKSGSEDLPIGKISSISFQRKRNYILSIVGFMFTLFGLYIILSTINSIGITQLFIIIIFILFGLLVGIANWIGHHNILLSASGKDRKPLKVEISKTNEGKEFVDAIKKVIIN